MKAKHNGTILVALLVVLAGCTQAAPPDRAGPAPSTSPPPVPLASTEPLDASIDVAAPPSANAGADQGKPDRAAAALAAATLERRAFRHLLVGALRYPPKRLTWVLFRSEKRAHSDHKTCLVGATVNLLEFFARESCGWCTPCREGLPYILDLLRRIEDGRGEPEYISMIERMCKYLWNAYCAFAPGAVAPVESLLKNFRDELEAHVSEKKCPFK